jgi:hypothetical protein
MWEAQVIAYERGGNGWLMWDWKNEDADEWSYQVNMFPFLLSSKIIMILGISLGRFAIWLDT